MGFISKLFSSDKGESDDENINKFHQAPSREIAKNKTVLESDELNRDEDIDLPNENNFVNGDEQDIDKEIDL